MMRAPEKVSTSVRRASGEITTQTENFISQTQKHKKTLGKPIIRGVFSFFEMLVLGIKTLNYSAEIAAADEKNPEDVSGPVSKKMTLALSATMIFSLVFAIVIFFFLPLLFAQLLDIHREALIFNLVAGFIRMLMFVLYIKGISYLKDIKRIFCYHGAEHKSIFAFEADLPLTVDNAAKFTTLHPRCGTSFILIVALMAILTYSISDTIFAQIAGHQPALLERFAIHFSLLPLVAGVSYELLKLSGKTQNKSLTKIFIAPGLWLQKITTSEPDAGQLEVALTALKASIIDTDLYTEAVRAE
ncbi:MAG: DUF1385 domain-containing protein [candidate division Zixibacteria bacterium]|nr:DUF1385 domain-containing protein [candidate division Zixibacteria bacterium]